MLDRPENLVSSLGQLFNDYAQLFPEEGRSDYFRRFSQIADYLNEHVHEQIGQSALLRDAQDLEKKLITNDDIAKIVYLNDHGPKHVQTVINRASDIVFTTECALTPYEIYILLAAIHFHDVGNLYGRAEHEKNIGLVMEHSQIKGLVGGGSAETRIIRRIAAAHGGNIDGDKDTIGKLPVYDAVLGQQVRVQLLAAILRFADELADDTNRAARFLLADGITKLYGSEIFHLYALHLDSVRVDAENKRVELHFWLYKNDALEQFQKMNTKVYLIDEIFERTLKMHVEAVYCMRFIRSAPTPDYRTSLVKEMYIKPIDTIKVEIKIFKDGQSDEPAFEINYSLRETGYPDFTQTDIYALCPEINKNFGRTEVDMQQLDGITLKRILEETPQV